MTTYTPDQLIAQFNRFELKLTADAVDACSHSGDCEDDVRYYMAQPEIRAELNKIPADKLAKELREYGAWDEEQLANHEDNLMRILWIAAGDIKEGR